MMWWLGVFCIVFVACVAVWAVAGSFRRRRYRGQMSPLLDSNVVDGIWHAHHGVWKSSSAWDATSGKAEATSDYARNSANYDYDHGGDSWGDGGDGGGGDGGD